MSILNKIMTWNCDRADVGDFRWDSFTKLWLLKSEEGKRKQQLLKQNEEFRDIHKGQRCFIFGNGPSLKDVDFSMFENEFVFTVNRSMTDPNFHKLKSNYHFWMDENGFGLRSEISVDSNVFLDEMKLLKNTENIVFFIPLSVAHYAETNNLNEYAKVAYIESFWNYRNLKKLDMSKVTPGFSTVVQYAVEAAIYMGFTEIYLLGCDNTVIISILNTAIGKSFSNLHYYEEEKNIQEKSFKDVIKNCGIRHILMDNLKIFDGYEKLATYCKKNNIKFINLSSETLIDCVDRARLEDIISCK